MLARKPRVLVAIALANKMARMVWAMLVTPPSNFHHFRDTTLAEWRGLCAE